MCLVNCVFMLVAHFYYTYNYHAQGEDEHEAEVDEVKKSNGVAA